MLPVSASLWFPLHNKAFLGESWPLRFHGAAGDCVKCPAFRKMISEQDAVAHRERAPAKPTADLSVFFQSLHAPMPLKVQPDTLTLTGGTLGPTWIINMSDHTKSFEEMQC